MLSVPVAVFAAPLYHLVQEPTSKSELILWLVGVALLWSYVGYVIGTARALSSHKRSVRRVVGVIGCLFAVLVLVGTPIHHVGILYWAATAVWLFVMFRHFLRLCFRAVS